MDRAVAWGAPKTQRQNDGVHRNKEGTDRINTSESMRRTEHKTKRPDHSDTSAPSHHHRRGSPRHLAMRKGELTTRRQRSRHSRQGGRGPAKQGQIRSPPASPSSRIAPAKRVRGLEEPHGRFTRSARSFRRRLCHRRWGTRKVAVSPSGRCGSVVLRGADKSGADKSGAET